MPNWLPVATFRAEFSGSIEFPDADSTMRNFEHWRRKTKLFTSFKCQCQKPASSRILFGTCCTGQSTGPTLFFYTASFSHSLSSDTASTSHPKTNATTPTTTRKIFHPSLHGYRYTKVSVPCTRLATIHIYHAMKRTVLSLASCPLSTEKVLAEQWKVPGHSRNEMLGRKVVNIQRPMLAVVAERRRGSFLQALWQREKSYCSMDFLSYWVEPPLLGYLKKFRDQHQANQSLLSPKLCLCMNQYKWEEVQLWENRTLIWGRPCHGWHVLG